MTTSRSGTQRHHHCLALLWDTRGWNLRLICMSYPRGWEWMREHWPDLRQVMHCQHLTHGQSNTCLMPLILQRRKRQWQRFTLTTWNGWRKQSNNTIYNIFILWMTYGCTGLKTQIIRTCWHTQRWGHPTWSRGQMKREQGPEKGDSWEIRENKRHCIKTIWWYSHNREIFYNINQWKELKHQMTQVFW